MKRFKMLVVVLGCAATVGAVAASQGTPDAPTAPGAGTGVWQLFWGSRDLFTYLLLTASLTGVALIFMNAFEIREEAFLPKGLAGRCVDLAKTQRLEALAEAVRGGESFLARVVGAGASRLSMDKTAVRDAAELTASEEAARWFRRIELLNTIGNIGPLIGLAGTVWGMILAFTSLGDHGGQAGPADLSLGISKALFHTLLGLCLAIPCLMAHSLFRGKVDRLCTRATITASEVVELMVQREGGAISQELKPQVGARI